MKALSIQQPWTWAILHLGKRVENRTWQAKRGGTILLHAGKKLDRDSLDDLEPMIRAIPEPRPPMHMGFLVGSCKIVDCIRVEDFTLDEVLAHGDWAMGPWCFILDDVKAFAKPIEWKGALGFFDVPDEIVAEQMS